MTHPGDVPPVVLASASAARVHIMRNAGLDFLQDPAELDEGAIKDACRTAGLSAEAAALRLAEAKAHAVGERYPESLVIGADQLLVSGTVWFDKPQSEEDACRTLRALRGGRHRLVSAAAVVRRGSVLWRHAAAAELTMRAYSDRFIDWYVAASGPAEWGVVGACRLEGIGAQALARVEGDYFTILGLPLLPLLDFFRSEGILID